MRDPEFQALAYTKLMACIRKHEWELPDRECLQLLRDAADGLFFGEKAAPTEQAFAMLKSLGLQKKVDMSIATELINALQLLVRQTMPRQLIAGQREDLTGFDRCRAAGEHII